MLEGGGVAAVVKAVVAVVSADVVALELLPCVSDTLPPLLLSLLLLFPLLHRPARHKYCYIKFK